MKTALPLIALLALLLTSCSSPQEPKDILNKLLEPKLAKGTWEELPSVVTTTLGYGGPNGEYLEGKYQVMNNYLVIRIFEVVDDKGEYHVAVYSQDEAKDRWKPLFAGEVVPGRLDTIIDLNGDQVPELIVDEYKGNNDWHESVQSLYAKLVDGNGYERIDTLSHRWFGGSAFNKGGAKYAYKTEENLTKIIVHISRAEMREHGPKETEGEYTLRWEPPHLVRENTNPQTQEMDPLAEANSEWDSLKNEERKAGLLTITYDNDGEMASSHDTLYFDGSLEGLKFLDSELIGEGGDYWYNHLEYSNGSACRGTFAETLTYDTENGVFFYNKGGQKYWFVIGSVINSENRHLPALVADPPTKVPYLSDNDFSAESAISNHVDAIRMYAGEFTPGKRYTRKASDGGFYSVDSLLWVKEFANR